MWIEFLFLDHVWPLSLFRYLSKEVTLYRVNNFALIITFFNIPNLTMLD
jgi:hypothetical protein